MLCPLTLPLGKYIKPGKMQDQWETLNPIFIVVLKYSPSLRLTEVEVTQLGFRSFFLSPPTSFFTAQSPQHRGCNYLHLMSMASTQALSSAPSCWLLNEAAWSITDPPRAACVTSLLLLLLQSHSTKKHRAGKRRILCMS